jgi:hypothetical protein
VRSIGSDERRARLAVRHRLTAASAARSPVEAARGVVALHATDPATVFLSLQARTADVTVEAIERALYEERTLVRMLGMRRTMFVVPTELVPVVQASSTQAVAGPDPQALRPAPAEAGVGDDAVAPGGRGRHRPALEARGEATGAQLSEDEPRLRTKVLMAAGKPYAAAQNVTTWVLTLASADGRIVRGRPIGSWNSSRYRWSPIEAWLPGGIRPMPADEARTELVRRWLAAFGPGTVEDLRWWTGWTLGQVRAALTEIRPAEVDLGGRTGLVLPDDLEPTPAPEPWVALLPALDATAMGWTERAWYLGPHAPALFDRNGNVGPTIWSDGRIVGGWAASASGGVAHRLLEDVGAEQRAAVESAAARLGAWIGDVRVTPRFRTPLERELGS